jgi:hypothetical protein
MTVIDRSWRGAIVGAVIGGAAGLAGTIQQTRKRRRADATAAPAGDED